MKTFKISLVAASFLVAFMLIFSACTKTDINAKAGGKVSLFLTDGPGEYDSVFIDFQKVEVKIEQSRKYLALVVEQLGVLNQLLGLLHGLQEAIGVAELGES